MSETDSTVAVVVPCYNEGQRLSDAQLSSLLDADPEACLVLVDDGSTDNTAQRLEAFADQHPERVHVLSMEQNQGKAEAVRRGLLLGCERGATFVAYLDADMATPPAELLRMYHLARDSDKDAVIGSRVALLGRDIERSQLRHLLGRIFATSASLILRASLYDTQCGAKVFRVTAALGQALAEPFASRWAFDVELLGRLLIESGDAASGRIVEEPLQSWSDIAGSKLGPLQMARVIGDLVIIRHKLAQRRAAREAGASG